MSVITHDQLQAKCFMWIWNSQPQLRYLAHGNLNNLTSHNGTKKSQMIKMAQLKSLGLVKGRVDFEFYYKGVLHVFDFKVGRDKLSKEQLEYISAIEAQGGKGQEIRSFEEFKERILCIIK